MGRETQRFSITKKYRRRSYFTLKARQAYEPKTEINQGCDRQHPRRTHDFKSNLILGRLFGHGDRYLNALDQRRGVAELEQA